MRILRCRRRSRVRVDGEGSDERGRQAFGAGGGDRGGGLRARSSRFPEGSTDGARDRRRIEASIETEQDSRGAVRLQATDQRGQARAAGNGTRPCRAGVARQAGTDGAGNRGLRRDRCGTAGQADLDPGRVAHGTAAEPVRVDGRPLVAGVCYGCWGKRTGRAGSSSCRRLNGSSRGSSPFGNRPVPGTGRAAKCADRRRSGRGCIFRGTGDRREPWQDRHELVIEERPNDMDPPRLALPGDLARSLRHLDDAQLEELPHTATARRAAGSSTPSRPMAMGTAKQFATASATGRKKDRRI